MPNNDIEVFEYLISDQATAVEIDYLTYAVFAHRKSHWLDHFEKVGGRKPTQTEVDTWIQQITDYDFDQMRSEAAEFFDSSAKSYLANYVEEQKKSAIDHSILSEVKVFSSPWRHAFIALAMA